MKKRSNSIRAFMRACKLFLIDIRNALRFYATEYRPALKQQKRRKESSKEGQKNIGRAQRIYFYRWWTQSAEAAKGEWLFLFFKHLYPDLEISPVKPTIQCCTLLDPHKDFFHAHKNALTVFFSGENIHTIPPLTKTIEQKYRLHDPRTTISLGFDYLDHEKYLRLPLWLFNYFQGRHDKDSVARRVDDFIRNQTKFSKTKFCALVSSHDRNGIRERMYNAISSLHPVSCGGRLLNNDDALQKIEREGSGDELPKIRYLQDFAFTICPENSYARGYVTEKIFDAMYAGCAPIYWGDPELEPFIKKDRVLYWDADADNESLLKEISALYADENRYKNFMAKPIVDRDGMIDFVWNATSALQEKVGRALQKT